MTHSNSSAGGSHPPADRSRIPVDHPVPVNPRPADRSRIPVDHSVPANPQADRFHPRPADRSHPRPADRSYPHPPADRSRIPVDHSVPANSHPPADRSRIPVDHRVPVNRPADGSHPHFPADRSRIPVDHPVPANPQADRSHPRPADDSRPHPPADRSHTPAGHPVPADPQAANNLYIGPEGEENADEHPFLADPQAVSDFYEGGDNADDTGRRKHRAARNSKSHEAKPSQLGYYDGPWTDVLVNARHNYRKHLHTNDPFPERNIDNLKDVQNILLEAIAEHKADGGVLDDGSYSFIHLQSLDSLAIS